MPETSQRPLPAELHPARVSQTQSEQSPKPKTAYKILHDALKPHIDDEATNKRFKKQLAIIGRLSPELIRDLYADMRASQNEEDRFRKKRGLPPREIQDSAAVRGRLFEQLVAIESNGSNSHTAQELLTLLHDPERFNLTITGRNPDLAFIQITEDNKVVIMATGEAKSGNKLDVRCFLQLSDSGILRHLRDIVNQANTNIQLSAQGFEHLSRFQDNISISPAYRNILYLTEDKQHVPLETLVDKESFYKHYIDREYAEEKYNEFLSLLADDTPPNPNNQLEVVYSCFNTQEIYAMANALLPHIRRRYQPYHPPQAHAATATP